MSTFCMLSRARSHTPFRKRGKKGGVATRETSLWVWFITLVDRLCFCQPSCCSSESIHCSCSSMKEDRIQSAGRRSQKLRGGELVPADIFSAPMSRSQIKFGIDLGTRLQTRHYHPARPSPTPPAAAAPKCNLTSRMHPLQGVACVMNAHTRWVPVRIAFEGCWNGEIRRLEKKSCCCFPLALRPELCKLVCSVSSVCSSQFICKLLDWSRIENRIVSEYSHCLSLSVTVAAQPEGIDVARDNILRVRTRYILFLM